MMAVSKYVGKEVFRQDAKVREESLREEYKLSTRRYLFSSTFKERACRGPNS